MNFWVCVAYVPEDCSARAVHLLNGTIPFAFCSMSSLGSTDASYRQMRLWSECGCAGWSESLLTAYALKGGFITAWLIWNLKKMHLFGTIHLFSTKIWSPFQMVSMSYLSLRIKCHTVHTLHCCCDSKQNLYEINILVVSKQTCIEYTEKNDHLQSFFSLIYIFCGVSKIVF